mmetsp:Transcript_1822/g.4667  ORF Transcript_1822/g.4667 Transcript_1822/m.4667 type:complete len:236 (-) Transcript_1822:535-1242(-)
MSHARPECTERATGERTVVSEIEREGRLEEARVVRESAVRRWSPRCGALHEHGVRLEGVGGARRRLRRRARRAGGEVVRHGGQARDRAHEGRAGEGALHGVECDQVQHGDRAPKSHRRWAVAEQGASDGARARGWAGTRRAARRAQAHFRPARLAVERAERAEQRRSGEGKPGAGAAAVAVEQAVATAGALAAAGTVAAAAVGAAAAPWADGVPLLRQLDRAQLEADQLVRGGIL